MNKGDLVINMYRATIFIWSEKTAEINGRDFFRCRLANETEIDLFNNYIEKNNLEKTEILKTKVLGIKVRGKASNLDNLSYNITISNRVTYTKLNKLKNDLNLNSIAEVIDYISGYSNDYDLLKKNIIDLRKNNEKLMKFINSITNFFNSNKFNEKF